MRHVLLDTFGAELDRDDFAQLLEDGLPAFQIEHGDYRFLIARGYNQHEQNHAMQAVSRWASREGIEPLSDYTGLADHIAFVEPSVRLKDLPAEEVAALPECPDLSAAEMVEESVVELQVTLPGVIGSWISGDPGGAGGLPMPIRDAVEFLLGAHRRRWVEVVTEVRAALHGGDVRLAQTVILRVVDQGQRLDPLLRKFRESGYETQLRGYIRKVKRWPS